MNKIIICILALCLLPLASFAQKLTPKPNSQGAGCLWMSQCGAGNGCFFNPSQGIGCDTLAGCNDCFRGLVQPPTDAKALDLQRQFVGYFQSYYWRGQLRERFIIAMAGPLSEFGAQAGDAVSRINGIRVTRDLMMRAKPLKGATVTVYAPGAANRARSVRL